jgi:hypothetical protein
MDMQSYIQQMMAMQQQKKAEPNPFATILAQQLQGQQNQAQQMQMQQQQMAMNSAEQLAGPGSIADRVRARRQAADQAGQQADAISASPTPDDSIPQTSGTQGVRPNREQTPEQKAQLLRLMKLRFLKDAPLGGTAK